jgi:hypothetical protein
MEAIQGTCTMAAKLAVLLLRQKSGIQALKNLVLISHNTPENNVYIVRGCALTIVRTC